MQTEKNTKGNDFKQISILDSLTPSYKHKENSEKTYHTFYRQDLKSLTSFKSASRTTYYKL